MAALKGAITTSEHHSLRHANAQAAISYEPLRDGEDGTIQSLEAMARAVRGEIPPDFSGVNDPYNQANAQLIIAKDKGDPLAALYRFVRDRIVYIEHPIDLQVVKDCRRALESRSGDCVTKSVCLATLAATRGFTPRFVAQDPDGSGFNHVYIEVNKDGEWVALDPTADGQNGRPLGGVGWRQVLPAFGVEMVYPIF